MYISIFVNINSDKRKMSYSQLKKLERGQLKGV